MKASTFLLALFVLLASTETSAGENLDGRNCWSMGGYKEKVCRVSMFDLIANQNLYDGKIVDVAGVFADGNPPLLFSSKDAYEVSRSIDSIAVEVEPGSDAARILAIRRTSNISVTGRYHSDMRMLENYSGRPVSGRIVADYAAYMEGEWGKAGTVPVNSEKDK